MGLCAVGAHLIYRLAMRWPVKKLEFDYLGDGLDFNHIENREVIVGFSGLKTRCYEISGISYDAIIEREQKAMAKGRASLFNNIGKTLSEIRLFGVKRDRYIDAKAEWPCKTLSEIGDQEANLYKRSFEITWFMVISHKNAKSLEEAHDHIMAQSENYGINPLIANEDLSKPCRQAGFLNHLVSGELKTTLRPLLYRVNHFIEASDMRFEEGDGTITTWTFNEHSNGPFYQKTISIKEYPTIITGMIIQDVMSIPAEIEVCQICKPQDQSIIKAQLSRQKITEDTLPWGSRTVSSEYEESLELLSTGKHTAWYTHLQFTVRSQNKDDLEATLTKVRTILSRHGMGFEKSTLDIGASWFNRLPKPNLNLLRPLFLFDVNIASLWPFHKSPIGEKASPFGNKPVRLLRTPTGSAYSFQFHVSDKPQSLGNFLVFAPSGSGKSTLIMHLLSGLAKFDDVRSYIFDSKQGARYMIESMGGAYQTYSELALNPLDKDDTPEARQKITLLLRAMAGRNLSSSEEIELNHVLEIIFQLPREQRRLDTIFDTAFNHGSELQRDFALWVKDSDGKAGQYSHVFNADRDCLSDLLSSSYMLGINMNEALEDARLAPPVVGHIASSIAASAMDTKGFCIFIDEAAKLLENEGFQNLAKEMYREYRKLNGVVGMAFQDPQALFNTGASEAFLENSSTLIFFPNAKVNPVSLERFNLNDEQQDFIINSGQRGGGRRVLVIKQDGATGYHESAILNVDLLPFGNATRFYRAGVEANKHLAQIKKNYGTDFLNHI